MKPGIEMMVLLPLLMFSNKLDLTTENAVLYLRIAFGCAQALAFGMYLVIWLKISRSADQKELSVQKMDARKQPIPNEFEKLTVQEYDTSKLKEAINQALISLALISFIHYKWEVAQVLLMQSVLVPVQLFKNELFRIHVFGSKAEGSLDRPFPLPQNPLASMFGGQQPEPRQPAEEKDETDEKKPKYADKKLPPRWGVEEEEIVTPGASESMRTKAD